MTTDETVGVKGIWERYGVAFLDLVYTRKCEGCDGFLESGREGVKRWICEGCFLKMEKIVAPYCEVCGEAYDGGMADAFRCGNCAGLKLHFDFAVAGYKAEGVVRELVHRFKYQRALRLRGVLGTMLERALDDPRLRAGGVEWTLVPVPLYHARQREREYNQAGELCRVLSKKGGLRVMDAMSRVRPTTAQASLSRNQRMENLRGAFGLKRGVLKKKLLEGRAVLLVDDVLTTGSTTSECARVLRREAGVEKVVVITVARG